jgi:hypothetical protein
MGSIMDWGRNQEEAEKTRESKCKSSPNGVHEWKMRGSWPSSWGECKYCKETFYSK